MAAVIDFNAGSEIQIPSGNSIFTQMKDFRESGTKNVCELPVFELPGKAS